MFNCLLVGTCSFRSRANPIGPAVLPDKRVDGYSRGGIFAAGLWTISYLSLSRALLATLALRTASCLVSRFYDALKLFVALKILYTGKVLQPRVYFWACSLFLGFLPVHLSIQLNENLWSLIKHCVSPHQFTNYSSWYWPAKIGENRVLQNSSPLTNSAGMHDCVRFGYFQNISWYMPIFPHKGQNCLL